MEPFIFMAGLMSWPILTLLFVSILITVEVAYDLGFLATLTTLVFAGVTWWLGWFSLAWASAHWMEVLIAGGGYVLLGILWTIAKWWFYVRARARYARELLANNPPFMSSNDLKAPQVADHKQDIVRWMAWWPFSLVSTLLDDPLRRLFEAIYRNLATLLQNIANHAFANITPPQKRP